jgi:hypothetical protein
MAPQFYDLYLWPLRNTAWPPLRTAALTHIKTNGHAIAQEARHWLFVVESRDNFTFNLYELKVRKQSILHIRCVLLDRNTKVRRKLTVDNIEQDISKCRKMRKDEDRESMNFIPTGRRLRGKERGF